MHRNSLVIVKGEPGVEDKETRDPATNVMSLDFSIFRDEVIATGEIPLTLLKVSFSQMARHPSCGEFVKAVSHHADQLAL